MGVFSHPAHRCAPACATSLVSCASGPWRAHPENDASGRTARRRWGRCHHAPHQPHRCPGRRLGRGASSRSRGCRPALPAPRDRVSARTTSARRVERHRRDAVTAFDDTGRRTAHGGYPDLVTPVHGTASHRRARRTPERFRTGRAVNCRVAPRSGRAPLTAAAPAMPLLVGGMPGHERSRRSDDRLGRRSALRARRACSATARSPLTPGAPVALRDTTALGVRPTRAGRTPATEPR